VVAVVEVTGRDDPAALAEAAEARAVAEVGAPGGEEVSGFDGGVQVEVHDGRLECAVLVCLCPPAGAVGHEGGGDAAVEGDGERAVECDVGEFAFSEEVGECHLRSPWGPWLWCLVSRSGWSARRVVRTEAGAPVERSPGLTRHWAWLTTQAIAGSRSASMVVRSRVM